MRDNGLNAASWVLLADLDPRVADAALDALRSAGVAAYTNPHPGIRRAYLDVSPMPQPTDQLYVDAAARERAEAVLLDLQEDEAYASQDEQTSTEGFGAYDPAEVDAEFARIIAGMDRTAPDSSEPPPAARAPPRRPRPAGRSSARRGMTSLTSRPRPRTTSTSSHRLPRPCPAGTPSAGSPGWA